jgi:uncharacterized damage-inducible protein DinB
LKEILVQYASYNLWANTRIVDKLSALPAEVLQKEVPSSFSSLHLTLKHIKEVEYTWWERLRLVESVVPLKDGTHSTEEIGKDLIEYSRQWKEWVEKSTVAAFEHEFYYRNSKKEQFKQPVYQMLMHLFNHQTYHRGQLVTMLRQLGIEQIPGTDFIQFSRARK